MLIVIAAVVAFIILLTAVRVIVLARSVAGFRTYWQQRANQTAPEDAITYIALGDSSAQGIGATQPEKGYVGLLASAIAEKTGEPVHVINLSVSGATIKDVSEGQIPQLKNLDVNDKTIVTLSIGGNDAVHNNAAFHQDIEALYAQLPKQTLVADIGYFGGGRYRSRELYVVRANEQLRAAATVNNLKVIDLYQITRERNSWRNNAVDIFHPGNRGYRNWFDAFWPEVEKQL